MVKKLMNKRVLIMGISFIALSALFCSCEPDEPSNPEDNSVYYQFKNFEEVDENK